jgi:hypothetical protein
VRESLQSLAKYGLQLHTVRVAVKAEPQKTALEKKATVPVRGENGLVIGISLDLKRI